jgi:hypothetical protein
MISDLDRFFAELETEEFSAATKPNATMATPLESKPDPYGARVRVVFLKINSPDYPQGMIAWLDKVHPNLYEDLISGIPNEIERLWNESVPLEQFQAVLDRWVALHREGCRLYREDQAASAQTGTYSSEKTAASESAHPDQNPAFQRFPTREECEISEPSGDVTSIRSNPEEPR